ncbi:hypothetical protein JCM19239_6911 [Vibrio variabilis]|uniref:Glutathione synthetase n=1 Tax=Vibrio variabilis TaxID=990271 RepID=A0ABQ0JNW7_9VIBR|nr:hypothetical protein JCM19239_6911 [Vibrio variabilis]
MLSITTLGYIAALCTTCSFVPQVLHILKTRDTQSISLAMYSIFVTGVALWLIYGLLVIDLPIIIANAITLILASIILILKIKHVATSKQNRLPKPALDKA